ncbi:hypothetical protein [Nocardia sp. NPDC005366]
MQIPAQVVTRLYLNSTPGEQEATEAILGRGFMAELVDQFRMG